MWVVVVWVVVWVVAWVIVCVGACVCVVKNAQFHYKKCSHYYCMEVDGDGYVAIINNKIIPSQDCASKARSGLAVS